MIIGHIHDPSKEQIVLQRTMDGSMTSKKYQQLSDQVKRQIIATIKNIISNPVEIKYLYDWKDYADLHCVYSCFSESILQDLEKIIDRLYNVLSKN